MKKFALVLAFGVLATFSAARADVAVKLANIDTNDCVRAQATIASLNTQQVAVQAVCSESGSFQSNNGRVYAYRLFSTITISGDVHPGMSFELMSIRTDYPKYTQQEIALLNSPRATFTTQQYGDLIYTTVTVN